jgi:ribonuclease HII
VAPHLEFEALALASGPVVGIDEVGRGALAGPVAVGAVLISALDAIPKGLDDSKELSASQREALVQPILDWCDASAVGMASAEEIDDWGLRTALAVAANRALSKLGTTPCSALIDGNLNLLQPSGAMNFSTTPLPELPFIFLPSLNVVKGDHTCASIAAASVIAKVVRDALMVEIGEQDSRFGWDRNKGYGAPEHLEALKQFGPTPMHRRSWALPSMTA